ncbi:MFS transporter [Planomonospora sp. ID91781]|uniref:MFS transporter n=1 Tax=Planomonospora sp. ID91781 TaxID=2738135 RepID=UPI0018C3688D|nr:MFS transporter [Planomonospora sp. ID91781]MBG0823728.1 MFS transporter [Planomonospora sp. ID91781]
MIIVTEPLEKRPDGWQDHAMVVSPSRRLLGLRLADGVTRGNMRACLSMAFASTMVISFLPAAQPYILSGVLGVPAYDQGKAVGLLGVAAEIAMIASLAWYGALADRYGRRPIAVAGFVLCALGTALFPFADSTAVLVALRVVFALGVAALNGMLSTVAADYVRDGSRGRSYGFVGLFSGLGAMVAVLALVRLPQILESGGTAPVTAARLSFLAIAAAVLAVGALMWFTLSRTRVAPAAERVPLARLIAEGVALARDPGIALSYAAAFVARADLAVVAGFMSLWVTEHALAEGGLSGAEALARAGAVVGVAQTVAMLGAPLVGWLGDRMRRQDVVILAQALAAVAYLSTLLVADPLGSGMMVVAVLIGLGEIAVITTAGPLLAQQAPAAVRGSAYGVQTLCGAVGILVVSGLGGHLYDAWRPAAPFVVAGVAGLLVVAFGLLVRRRVTPLGEPPAPRQAPALRPAPP